MAKKKKISDDELIDGLNPRHVSAIIRRKMMEKVKPSDKAYKRKNSALEKTIPSNIVLISLASSSKVLFSNTSV